MQHARLRIDGKDYVLVPKDEYRRLTHQDRLDGATAQRALARWRKGRLATTSHEALKRKLGL